MRIICVTSLALILSAAVLLARDSLPGELYPEVPPHGERPAATTRPAKKSVTKKRTKNQRRPATKPAKPLHFLTLESSRKYLQQIGLAAAGPSTSLPTTSLGPPTTRPNSPKSGLKSIEATLRKIASGSDVWIERDEARLLLAIAAMKAGRTKEAAGGFARLTEADTAAVAQTSQRYAYLAKACPGGILDGFSIAQYKTYLAACNVFADVEARKGKALTRKAAGASVMTLALWRSAWKMQKQAAEAYGIAAMLDKRFAPSAKDKAALAKTRKRLATAGVRLLGLEVDRQKAKLISVIKRLRQDSKGNWKPPAVIKRADGMIAAIQKTKRQMQEIMADAFGRRWTRQSALANTINEADCLKISKAGNKAKLRDHLSKLFREVSSRLAHRNHHLFRLRSIAKPRQPARNRDFRPDR